MSTPPIMRFPCGALMGNRMLEAVADAVLEAFGRKAAPAVRHEDAKGCQHMTKRART